ncbi:hypothetical protein [Salinisphaera orenii]|uniref:Uncharacterized protein n=1 Tax=Salinisphaera orenii YIM 95161 TaxID=1051139 RepID=A0A423Q369_9GAMM|nr:hypothetical protein [Salinisphaera halophila]ROO33084.1 hypothetical protein SAHL_03975 [Salinisphaera halophila YIM 95161]
MTTSNTAGTLIHPAHGTLYRAARDERRRLARALSIEADWRFHDGPEWAARYWAAFGDLRRDRASAPEMRMAAAQAEREHWSTLTATEAAVARDSFRALLALLHPRVVPQAAAADGDGLWPRAMAAYRHGDRETLARLLPEARPLARHARLPQAVVALRREHDRLRAAREHADRRLAELSQQFPFCLRDRLADADWIRRQRLALRQALALTAAPQSGVVPRKRVS